MIPLSAQCRAGRRRAAGSLRPVSHSASVSQISPEIVAAQGRSRAPPLHRPSWNESNSADLAAIAATAPHWSAHCRIRRRLFAAHRLPHCRGVPTKCSRRSEGWKSNCKSAPGRRVDGGKCGARPRLGIGGVEDLRQCPFEQRELRQNGLLGIGRIRRSRNPASSAPYQRIERCTEGWAATNSSPMRRQTFSSPSTAYSTG